MATLSGSTIASTYDRLLALPSGGLNGASLVALTDGNASGTISLQISTTKTMIEGSGNKLFFHDEGDEHISATGGVLSIAGGSEIDLTATAIDINGTVDISGTLALNDDVTIIQNKKIYFDSTDTYIYANTDNPEDLVIGADADILLEPDGNVGIKESSPLATLHINSNSGDNTTVLNSGADDLMLETAGGNCGMTIYSGNSTALGLIYFGSDESTTEGNIIFTHSTTAADRMLQFGFDVSPKFTLLGSGNVGIGVNTPTSTLHVKVADTTDTANCAHFECTESDVESADVLVRMAWSADSDVDAAKAISFHDSVGEIGSVSMDGNATAFNTSSDYRLKTDFKDIVDATGIINQLKLYDFAWKKNTSKRLTGVIAHEAAEIVPYAVIGEKDAMITDIVTPAVRAVEAKDAILDDDGNVIEEAVEAVEAADEVTEEVISAQGTDYSKFVPLLLKAIQELSDKVDALESA